MQENGIELNTQSSQCVADELIGKQRHPEDSKNNKMMQQDFKSGRVHFLIGLDDIDSVVDEVTCRETDRDVCKSGLCTDHVIKNGWRGIDICAYERTGEYRVNPGDEGVLEAPEVFVGCQVD